MRLLHPHLVTFACQGSWSAGDVESLRDHAFHFAITEDEIHPLDPMRLFTSPETIAERMRETCESAVAETEDELGAGSSCDRLVARLGTYGIELVFAASDFRTSAFQLEAELPYEELADVIPDGGLLDRLLAGEAPVAPPTPADADAIAVSHTDLDYALFAAWQTLAPGHARVVGLRRFEHGLAQLVYRGAQADVAAGIAVQLGALPVPTRAARDVQPLGAWRTRDDVILRERPGGAILRSLSRGTVVGIASPSDRGRFVEVLTPFGSGSVARALLTPIRGCVPRPPDALAGRAQPLTSILRVEHAGVAIDAVLFVRRTRSALMVRLHVLRPATCTLGDELAAIDAEGDLFDLRSCAAAPGGETILVVGTTADEPDETRYVAHALAPRGLVWSETIRRPSAHRVGLRLSETAESTYFPVSIETWRGVRRLAWTGTALAEQAPPP